MKKNGDFKNNWEKYIRTIIPNANFPTEFAFKSVEDVTTQFGYKNSAIKIGKSLHEEEIVLYHIFVNINYKI